MPFDAMLTAVEILVTPQMDMSTRVLSLESGTMVLSICTTTKYNSRLSHNISYSKIKSRQVTYQDAIHHPSRNAQDTVRPYETNPFRRPATRDRMLEAHSETLINMNYYQAYIDNYFDIP
jgi:hypothetical protein